MLHAYNKGWKVKNQNIDRPKKIVYIEKKTEWDIWHIIVEVNGTKTHINKAIIYIFKDIYIDK